MNAAGWCLDSTFAKFYDRPIRSESHQNFGEAVLSSTSLELLPLYFICTKYMFATDVVTEFLL